MKAFVENALVFLWERGDYPISVVLNDREDEWWISRPGSCPGGLGAEWLEFSFPGLRRVSCVGLMIPPLPYGPLSVREFHLEVEAEGKWRQATKQLVTPPGHEIRFPNTLWP